MALAPGCGVSWWTIQEHSTTGTGIGLSPATDTRQLTSPATVQFPSKLAHRRTNSAERVTESSRRRGSWTPEQVEHYFSGLTDAASHLAERASNNYLNSGLPLSPLPKSSRPTKFVSDQKKRLSSSTDPRFLDHTPGKMGIRRCTICHLFIEGAPRPDLVHVGAFGETCRGQHHPNPCDYIHKDSGSCTEYGIVGKAKEDAELTNAQLLARDHTRQDELDKMSAEIITLKSKEGEYANMVLEMAEMKSMINSLRNPPGPGGTLAASTGLGQVQQPPHLQHSGDDALLQADVQDHIDRNRVPPTTTLSAGSYEGPTMTEMRKDAELDRIAMKVLAALEGRIPQIRVNVDQAHPQVTLPIVNTQQQQTPTLPLHPSQPLTTQTNVTSALRPGPTSSLLYSNPSPQLASQTGIHHPAYAALRGLGADVDSQPPLDRAQRGGGGVLLSDDEFLDASAIMQLCTVSNRRQLRPHEFAKMGRFSYANKITDKNITIPLYVMGYLQHVVALLKGVVPVQSDTEVVDRLVNLMTVMEITANNSTLEDFQCPGWQIGLEYGGRIFHDIEYGRLKWENLSDGLQPHTFLYAKDTVEQQARNSRVGGGVGQPRGRGKGRGGGAGRGRGGSGSDRSDEGIKVCQSYNGFWTGNGCAYEFSSNRKCSYEHFCSNCFEKTGAKEKHKAYYCTSPATTNTGVSAAGTKPVVTTSG